MNNQMTDSLKELIAWAKREKCEITIIGTDLPKPVIPGKKKPETLIVPLTARRDGETTLDDCVRAIEQRYKIERYKPCVDWKICIDGEWRECREVTLKIGNAYN
jgi:hypothetical protein